MTALTDLTDVSISSPQNKDGFRFDSASGKWINSNQAAMEDTENVFTAKQTISLNGEALLVTGTTGDPRLKVQQSTDNIDTILACDTTHGILKTVTSHSLALGTSNADRVTIDTAGKVGIGTTSPGNLLSLKPSTNVAQLRLEQDNATDSWTLHADSGGGPLKIARTGALVQAISLLFYKMEISPWKTTSSMARKTPLARLGT